MGSQGHGVGLAAQAFGRAEIVLGDQFEVRLARGIRGSPEIVERALALPEHKLVQIEFP